MRWNKSEFMASMSDGCIDDARSGESLEVITCPTGSTITSSAGLGSLDNDAKIWSILLSQAEIPPDEFA